MVHMHLCRQNEFRLGATRAHTGSSAFCSKKYSLEADGAGRSELEFFLKADVELM